MGRNLPDRQRLIELYEQRFREDGRVRALWLEGADGLGLADEYSDVDLWLDALDEAAEAVLEDAIGLARRIGPLDVLHEISHQDGKILQATLHIAGMSPYLTVDLCVQKHSRVAEGCCIFRSGDMAELPRVLLDRDGIIALRTPEPLEPSRLRRLRAEAMETFAQRGRVTKYLARKRYLEALAHYEEYVLEPLVTLARLLHTPYHPDYGWTHITRHLPDGLVARLEGLRSHRGLDDLPGLLEAADVLFKELNHEFTCRYGG